MLARMPGRWRGVEQLKDQPFRELTLKVSYDPRRLLAGVTRYFLPDRKVHVIGPRVRLRARHFETISRASPLLMQDFGCEGAGHADVIAIAGVGCALFAPPAFDFDTLYPFSRTFLFLAFDGMTAERACGALEYRQDAEVRIAGRSRTDAYRPQRARKLLRESVSRSWCTAPAPRFQMGIQP